MTQTKTSWGFAGFSFHGPIHKVVETSPSPPSVPRRTYCYHMQTDTVHTNVHIKSRAHTQQNDKQKQTFILLTQIKETVILLLMVNLTPQKYDNDDYDGNNANVVQISATSSLA